MLDLDLVLARGPKLLITLLEHLEVFLILHTQVSLEKALSSPRPRQDVSYTGGATILKRTEHLTKNLLVCL